MGRNKLEFWVDEEFIQNTYYNSPISNKHIIEFRSDQITVENVLNMPDEDLKIIFCELLKKFATPKSSGTGRKFSFDL